jgi:hypothetical protein
MKVSIKLNTSDVLIISRKKKSPIVLICLDTKLIKLQRGLLLDDIIEKLKRKKRVRKSNLEIF